MDSLKRFFSNILLSYKSIYGFMSLRAYLVLVILVPFFQTALFSYLNYFINGETGMRYAALGNALYTICIFVVFTMGASITTERRLGTLQTILLSPTNKPMLFVTKSVLHVLEGIVTCCFSLAFGRIFLKLNFDNINWMNMIAVILLTTVMMIGVGMFAGVLGLLFRKATPILNSINLSIFLLCGVNFPVDRLPKGLQIISDAIPLTYGIRLLRAVYKGEGILNMDLLYLCITGVVFFVVSNRIFIISENYSRQKGTLDYY
ncbi:MAG: ABC transporter permease [Lutisporaceae bacterium]